MKVLILYSSLYGNTEIIAKEMVKGFSSKDKINVLCVDNTDDIDVKGYNLLLVGSPTQGGRASEKMQLFLNSLSSNSLKGIKVASFDTRFLESKQNFALKLLMKKIGYAAPKILDVLVSKGGLKVTEPKEFIVEGKSGPLAKGELENAIKWVKIITNIRL